jgi:hypothetical protein
MVRGEEEENKKDNIQKRNTQKKIDTRRKKLV